MTALFRLLFGGCLLWLSSFLQAHDTLWLHQNWSFSREGADQWLDARVPGTVHLDLLRHQRIPHPYVGIHEQEVQWVEMENWEYQTQFQLTEADLAKRSTLVLEGLDTYADVFLNGKLLLQAGNMFRKWEVDVDTLLHQGANHLRVVFYSPILRNRHRQHGASYHLTAGNDAGSEQVAAYVRKAPFQFGWDWGPRLVTCGIWQPVYLVQWEAARFEGVQIYAPLVDTALARIRLQTELFLSPGTTATLQLRDLATGKILCARDFSPTTTPGRPLPAQLAFEVPRPRLWWTHDQGDPHLYHWQLELSQGDAMLQRLPVRYGIRTIELIREPDSVGVSYSFKLNGKPIFAKGANYIPMDALHPAHDRTTYARLLASAKEVHMNMIRVWGGGVYPDDAFYDLCDEWGILVWQDLMFADAMYPADPAFLENVEAEVRYQHARIQRHPSLALWCGNNEIDVAWHNWGWQKQFHLSPPEAAQMWQDYETLFLKTFPRLLEGGAPYVHTSPLSNWGKPENFHSGSMHYWGVWHGKDDLSQYAVHVGRFMSEYGFQSFPDERTVRYFAPDEASLSLESEAMRWHQKSYIGNGEILRQMIPILGEPRNFSDFLYKSQLTQLEGMRTAIRHHRKRKGHCMGTLYWQLNDCWPGPSWSSIDHFGRWKAFHYHLRELYAEVLIVPESRNDSLFCAIVSDRPDSIAATLRIEAHDLGGQKLKEFSAPIWLSGTQVVRTLALALPREIAPYDPRNLVFYIEVFAGDSLLASTFHYLVNPRELALSKPQFTIDLDPDKKQVHIASNVVGKSIFLKTAEDLHFSDNYFDLLPNRSKTITYEGDLKKRGDIEVISLNPSE